jgi:hypothetical protein
VRPPRLKRSGFGKRESSPKLQVHCDARPRRRDSISPAKLRLTAAAMTRPRKMGLILPGCLRRRFVALLVTSLREDSASKTRNLQANRGCTDACF